MDILLYLAFLKIFGWLAGWLGGFKIQLGLGLRLRVCKKCNLQHKESNKLLYIIYFAPQHVSEQFRNSVAARFFAGELVQIFTKVMHKQMRAKWISPQDIR